MHINLITVYVLQLSSGKGALGQLSDFTGFPPSTFGLLVVAVAGLNLLGAFFPSNESYVPKEDFSNRKGPL